jgi:hypothetical protein
MAYATSNPPEKLVSNLDGTFNIWVYRSTDPTTDVDGANYFTNGVSLGMKAGDIVFSVDTDASPVVTSLYYVNAASADGSVDLTNATVLTVTDSD